MIKSRSTRWAVHVVNMGEVHTKYAVRKPEGKSTLGRSRYRWKDDIKMEGKEIGDEGVSWFNLIQDSVQWRGSHEHGNGHLQVTQEIGNFLSS
jgi:hypothetical protein